MDRSGMSTPLSKIRGFFEIVHFSTFLKQYILGPKSKSNFPKMGNFLRPGNPVFYNFIQGYQVAKVKFPKNGKFLQNW